MKRNVKAFIWEPIVIEKELFSFKKSLFSESKSF